MAIIIKPMETEDEIRGKAWVHWKSWQESYAGIVDAGYLAQMTPESCEEKAFRWRDNIFVAKDGERVVGFAGYGKYRDETMTDTGEIFAIYVLSEYCGKGVGHALITEALKLLPYPKIAVWELKGNARATRFYEKHGFVFDGCEQTITLGTPVKVVRMILNR